VNGLTPPATASSFRSAFAADADTKTLALSCIEQLRPGPAGANLGFIYAADALAPDLSVLVSLLRERTEILDWVGCVGFGICGSGGEVRFDAPALAVMAAALPPESVRPFGPISGNLNRFAAEHGAWTAQHQPPFGVVHGDPRMPSVAEAIAALSARSGGAFLVGGLSSGRSAMPQVAGNVVAEGGGLSGVLLAPEIKVATGLTQGCSPIGPVREVTAAGSGIVMTIDGRPALDVFKDDIGELFARDLRRVAGQIFAALPVRGVDTGDYLVRNLVGIDKNRGWLGIAADLAAGDRILFCRRDPASAQTDMRRMLAGLKARMPDPRAALYHSCVARGPNLFAEPDAEIEAIRETFGGDLPVAGFFGNGEICNDRLYTYTGVLTLFG
jgi:small ligand-binding sensory domain FIST